MDKTTLTDIAACGRMDSKKQFSGVVAFQAKAIYYRSQVISFAT